jgi:hypothetical protein
METRIVPVVAVLIFSMVIAACGGGGGSSSSDVGGTLSASGFTVPTEISAVPTNTSGGSSKSALKSSLIALAATDLGTDYSNAVTVKFVEERTLEQFNIIEQIMKALAQTLYADTENINQGPYKAMVAWQDNQNGVQIKTLEPWIVDSSLIVEDGQNVNRVQVWIEEPDGNGGTRLIKAEFKIYASATLKSDGSYQDYGVWKLNVKFDDAGTSFFAADASIGPNGESILKLHENSIENDGSHVAEAILNKSDAQGFGKVLYPDWSDCISPDCAPTSVTAKYAYDATHLAVQKGSDAIDYKDRNTVTDLTRRYGMFDSVTGDNILKTKSFGFPVQFTLNGVNQFAYYGAWQGRHQLWAGEGMTVPAGTVVTRQDRGPNQATETYTVSAPFVGTLTKRTLAAADVNDILNIPVETWLNINYNLMWDGANWIDCKNMTFNPMPTCGTGSTTITDFSFLVNNPNDHRKFIGINHWDNNTQTNTDLMYDPNGGSGAGFYVAIRDQMGNLTNTGTIFTPSGPGDQLFANIGGSIYIEYVGAGWVEKTLLSFDETTWTPTFDPAGDQAYAPDLNREYYINNQGVNYVVKKTSTGPDVYDVQIELQSVANPVNASTFLPAGTYFKPQWDNGSGVSFQFVTDSASPNFLKLVYKSVGTQPGVHVGDVVTQGQWGLGAYDINDASTGVQFNWDYPSEGQNFGTLTYLTDDSGAYKLLDDPIRLNPITLINNAGQSKTLALQFDGWMGGLPDLYQELQKNNFVMTADIADKVINIPAGTPADDAVDANKHYLIKPLEISEFLNVVADPGTLDITIADSVDLATVPNFVEHNMGPIPTVTGVKYSEGVLVQ